jgi:hypothetical protein
MTTEQKVARRKLSLLELAHDLGNVSKACRIVGYSRQQFYEIRRNFQIHGAAGLLDKLAGPRNPHPNRLAEEVEAAILAHALEHPCHGALRVANELALQGIQVSSSGERGRSDEFPQSSLAFNAAMNALCGISTSPNWRMRFLPAFCLSSSLRLREMSPP